MQILENDHQFRPPLQPAKNRKLQTSSLLRPLVKQYSKYVDLIDIRNGRKTASKIHQSALIKLIEAISHTPTLLPLVVFHIQRKGQRRNPVQGNLRRLFF
jgi:hypothetical protein